MKLLDTYTFLTPFSSYFTPDFKSEMQLFLQSIWDIGLTKHGKLIKKFATKNQIICNELVLYLHSKPEH